MMDTSKYIVTNSGFRGFYAGLLSLLIRDIPFSSIQFTIYEHMRKRSVEKNQGSPLTFLQNSFNGAFAAAIAAFVTTPIDVAKTRLMTQRDGYYRGVFDCFRKIVKNEGVRKLFLGVEIRTFNIAMSGIIFFAAYEKIRGKMEDYYRE